MTVIIKKDTHVLVYFLFFSGKNVSSVPEPVECQQDTLLIYLYYFVDYIRP